MASVLNYMGYTITSSTVGGGFTANVKRTDPLGKLEEIALSGASEAAAIDAAKKVVRLAVRSKLPLTLAIKVAGEA